MVWTSPQLAPGVIPILQLGEAQSACARRYDETLCLRRRSDGMLNALPIPPPKPLPDPSPAQDTPPPGETPEPVPTPDFPVPQPADPNDMPPEPIVARLRM
jgi:hypothetical protein